MVSFLPPDASITFLAAAIIPLILGFIVGLIVKSVLKIGIALAVIAVALIVLGIISPEQVLTPIMSLFKSGTALSQAVSRLAGYLPYSSITFLIGLVIGFLRG